MTSKKGAKEETKKNINLASRGQKKKAFKLKGFFNFFFWRGEGVRGDLGGSVQGGGRSSAGNRWRETSSTFCENRDFSLRSAQLFEIIENRRQPLLSDRAKSFIRLQSLELKL